MLVEGPGAELAGAVGRSGPAFAGATTCATGVNEATGVDLPSALLPVAMPTPSASTPATNRATPARWKSMKRRDMKSSRSGGGVLPGGRLAGEAGGIESEIGGLLP